MVGKLIWGLMSHQQLRSCGHGTWVHSLIQQTGEKHRFEPANHGLQGEWHNHCIMNTSKLYNALVICNHAPPPWNSQDFDFWSSKSPLKVPPCGDCSLVKSLLSSPTACYLSIFIGPFHLYKHDKANPVYFPYTAVAKLWSKPR